MDNLIAFVPFILGLTLFSVLYAAERLSARRHRRKVERRVLGILRDEADFTVGAMKVGQCSLCQDPSHPLHRHSLTYPRIPRPYQRKAR